MGKVATLLFDIYRNIVWLDVSTATELMAAVASGQKILQLICSRSGFGKTAIAKKEFRRHGIVPQKPIEQEPRRGGRFIETRPVKPISLVRKLWHCYVHSIDVLLLDDPGKIASDEASCDVLKTAYGVQRTVMYETPEITRNAIWRDQMRMYNPGIPDPQFPCNSRLLWLANTNFADPAIIAKLGDHFEPLIARGLNPFWIRDDAENDQCALFLYVWWLATEGKLLRSMGFSYEVSAQAVNYFVAHAHDLRDLAPRRVELLARAFNNPVAGAREAELRSMLSTTGGDLRPKLKLPAAWVTVIDGTPQGALMRPLAKPETPPQEPEKPDPDPEPDPEPPPASRAKPPEAEPELEPPPPMLLLPAPAPQPPLPDLDDDDQPDQPDEPVSVICLPDDSLQDPPEQPWRLARHVVSANLSTGTALRLLSRQRGDWDLDDYHEFARFLLEVTWHGASGEQQQRIQDYVYHSTGTVALVYGAEAVIELDETTGELHLTPWPEIATRLAPAVANARAEDDQQRRMHMGKQILVVWRFVSDRMNERR